MLKRSVLGLAIVLAAVALACDKSPLLAPTESTISVTAASKALPLGGSTQVTAMVIEPAGTPVQNGTTVRFITSLGRVDPVEAQTRNGVATTTFFAGDQSGLAAVKGISGGATASGGTNGGSGSATCTGDCVEITVGAAGASAVLVSASPSRVPSSGGTVTIIASGVDANGNRLVNVPVSFSTTAGSLSSTSATTDSAGEARVQLTTNREATVTARIGGQSATTTVTAGAPSTLALSASPTNPTVGQPVTLTITPTIPSGNPPPVVSVNWGDGTTDNLGTVSAARNAVHTYSSNGAFTVTATASADGDSFSTSIVINVGLTAGSVDLSVSPTTGTTATSFVFTVTLGSGTATNVVLNFGDSTSTTLSNTTQTQTVNHTYSTTGTKTATVTQTNSGGATTADSVIVTVN